MAISHVFLKMPILGGAGYQIGLPNFPVAFGEFIPRFKPKSIRHWCWNQTHPCKPPLRLAGENSRPIGEIPKAKIFSAVLAAQVLGEHGSILLFIRAWPDVGVWAFSA